MTWGNPPKLEPTILKPGKKITPEQLAASGSEDGHQMAVFCWAADNCGQYPALKWLHAIPNGGSRHIVEAGKMVAAGLRSGVWDIFGPMPKDGYCGIYLEMKEEGRRNKKDGGLSKEQIEFGQYAENAGYFCAVCYTWIEARDTLINYLDGRI